MSLHTPREVLNEIRGAKTAHKPWWATKLADRMLKHLEHCYLKGQCIADMRMSEAACEAVLEEARKKVREPDPQDPVGEMLYDMRAAGRA